MSLPERWRIIQGSDQKLTVGAASVQSAAFGANTYAIMVTATTNTHIQIGMNPVATANTYLVKASDFSLIIGVSPGEKLAALEDAAAGSLYIVELTA